MATTTRAIQLSDSIDTLPGIGQKTAEVLRRLSIVTVRDLLLTIPTRYEDVHVASTPDDLTLNAMVTVTGVLSSITARRAFRGRRLFIVEAHIDLGNSSSIRATWFNQPYVAKQYAAGDGIRLTGKLTQGKYGIAMSNPTYEKVGAFETDSAATDKAQVETTDTHADDHLLPIYPLTTGISQKQMQRLVWKTLGLVKKGIRDEYNAQFLREHQLLGFVEALENMHKPRTREEAMHARKRILFDRLCIHQLAIATVKAMYQSDSSPQMIFDQSSVKAFTESLPFLLTDDQRKVAWRILQDSESGKPMNRLLIGDVGSGKTVVAAIAALNTIQNGYQVALMAPTDLLAKQHAQTFEKLFQDTNISVSLYTQQSKKDSPKQTRSKKNLALTDDIIIGTHALIQDSVVFRRLGLAIVDEQHRFGVLQRKMLTQHAMLDGKTPHFLSMSATPIPRTLALSLYGDVDLSVIVQMPAGRKPVLTEIVDGKPAQMQKLFKTLRERADAGEQTFVLCPLIEDSDKLSASSVESTAKMLQADPKLSGLRIASLHGRMKQDERDALMLQMKNHEIDILVSTTVIEVGIDIPDATTMVILNGERFGLAQLHQLRGRVGRREKQSYCVVVVDHASVRVHERLSEFARTHNGFALAELDLKLRGAGDVYGIRQSGFAEELNMALEHPELLEQAQRAAKEMLEDPKWQKQFPGITAAVERQVARLHFE